MEYCAGFLFDNDLEFVVLIRKEKPAWQRGKLNGVGGKIEEGETPAEAMRREFLEETGMDIKSWEQYVTLTGEGFTVHFFHAHTDNPWAVKSTTDEAVAVFELEHLTCLQTIPNLQWLIPMAMTLEKESAMSFVVTEQKAAA